MAQGFAAFYDVTRPQPSPPKIRGDTIGKASQRKGRAGEIELAHILQAHGYNVEPGRSQSFGEVPDLSGLPGVHIECKRVERLNISQAMAQAVRDAERFQDGAPAVFHRRNREPWLVTMRLEDWLDIWGSSQSPGNLAKSRKIST